MKGRQLIAGLSGTAGWLHFATLGPEKVRQRLATGRFGQKDTRLAQEWLAHQSFEAARVAATASEEAVCEARRANELSANANELASEANKLARTANAVASEAAAAARRAATAAEKANTRATIALIIAIASTMASSGSASFSFTTTKAMTHKHLFVAACFLLAACGPAERQHLAERVRDPAGHRSRHDQRAGLGEQVGRAERHQSRYIGERHYRVLALRRGHYVQPIQRFGFDHVQRARPRGAIFECAL